MLNENSVKELFERESILIGSSNVVPVYRVREIFGEKATEFALNLKLKPGVYSNSFGIGEYSVQYVNYKGFQMAGTYYNVEKIREIEKIKG